MKFKFSLCLLLSIAVSSTAAFAQGSVTPHMVPAEPAPASAAMIQAPVAVPAAPKNDVHPPSLFDEGPTQTPASIVVSIRTFRNISTVDVLAASPYPVRPPKATKINALPEGKYLRPMLLGCGYQNPMSLEKPYPIGGLRMQFAMKDAVKRSGLGYPHGILGEYSWADQILPYASREVRRWNKIEDERWQRYQRACEQFDKERVQCEVEAARLGLYPVQLKRKQPGVIRGKLDPGNWWITCTRKVPGLVYYWQVPITLAAGDNVTVYLNDQNALLITGAW